MMSVNRPNGNPGHNGRNDHALLFGYTFPGETPYEPAPALPSGPALLNDNESSMLEDFFTNMNSDASSNFWPSDFQQDPNKSLGLTGLEWATELPPTFEGSTTSLPTASSFHQIFEKPLGIFPQHSSSNPDVVTAASMLNQNGLHGPEINTDFGDQPLPGFFNYPLHKGSGKEPQQTDNPSRRLSTSSRTHLPVGYHTQKMLFDVHNPISPEKQLSTKVQPLHWGSDISFMDQGYVAPPDQPDEEQRTKELMENLECLEPQSSATNTRAPTPDRVPTHHGIPWIDTGAINHMNAARIDYGDNPDGSSHPKKKQRLSIKEEDDDFSEEDTSRQRSKRSKGSSRRLSNDAIRKSRASQNSKQPRENLTEEQKRSNHILSEQKRRNLIRKGFDDLCILVPGLKGGGFSKSAMLSQAADWLEIILRDNDTLRTQLADLKSRNNGLIMPR
ncbi:hypothetical protein BJX70DRAFT_360281 [Aspergillus crustosus]